MSSEQVDVLCLQETFSKRLRKPLIDSLSRHYYSYSDYTCNKTIFGPLVKDCYGGLMTWSKFPIIKEKFYPFSRVEGMNFEEKIGGKGFLISTIITDDRLLHIVNTHLYSGMDEKSESIRYHQVQEIKNILSLNEYLTSPVILAGDFNITHPGVASKYPDLSPSKVYEIIGTDLGFTDSCPNIDEYSYTIDPRINSYQSKGKHLQ